VTNLEERASEAHRAGVKAFARDQEKLRSDTVPLMIATFARLLELDGVLAAMDGHFNGTFGSSLSGHLKPGDPRRLSGDEVAQLGGASVGGLRPPIDHTRVQFFIDRLERAGLVRQGTLDEAVAGSR
jgi:hypothetical protein